MLQLAGRVGLGVDVRDFLELQRAFHGDRVMVAAPEEERIRLHGEALGPGADLRLEFEHVADRRRQVAQRAQFLGLHRFAQTSAQLGDDQRQQVERGELRGEGLGRGDADLRTGARDEAQRVGAHQRRLGHVADAQRLRHAERLGVFQCGQRVGRLARLREGDDQRLRVGDGFAVAVFARHLDVARDSGHRFEPVARDESSVVAGAAGDDQDLADVLEHFLGAGAEQAGLDAARGAEHLQRVRDRHRLLEHFLLHVVAVLAEFDGVGGELRFGLRAFDRRAVEAGDAITGACQLGAIAVLQIDDAARDLQERRDVGRRVVAVRGQSKEQRRAVARDDDMAGVGLAQHGDGVGSLQLRDGVARCREEVRTFLQFRRDQVRDDFGIGVRIENIALGAQPRAQDFVVLDDAVVHDGEAARNVRMRVALAGNAVRRPARVRDTGCARGAGLVDLSGQFGDAANGAQALQPGTVDQGETGRVIATVFELAQAFNEDRDDVAVSDRGDDSTHDSTHFLILTGRFQPGMDSCLARETVSVSGGASLVSVVPAPSVAPRPTRTGATSCVSEPMKTSSSMIVRNLLAPS